MVTSHLFGTVAQFNLLRIETKCLSTMRGYPNSQGIKVYIESRESIPRGQFLSHTSKSCNPSPSLLIAMKLFHLGVPSLVVRARHGSSSHYQRRGDEPCMPIAPGTTQNCASWYDNDGSLPCELIPYAWNLSLEDLIRWVCYNSYPIKVEANGNYTTPPSLQNAGTSKRASPTAFKRRRHPSLSAAPRLNKLRLLRPLPLPFLRRQYP